MIPFVKTQALGNDFILVEHGVFATGTLALEPMG